MGGFLGVLGTLFLPVFTQRFSSDPERLRRFEQEARVRPHNHAAFSCSKGLFRVVNVIGFDDQRDRNVFTVGRGFPTYFFDTA
jgi:hypothetical protein